jgi:hypothetical protein
MEQAVPSSNTVFNASTERDVWPCLAGTEVQQLAYLADDRNRRSWNGKISRGRRNRCANYLCYLSCGTCNYVEVHWYIQYSRDCVG